MKLFMNKNEKYEEPGVHMFFHKQTKEVEQVEKFVRSLSITVPVQYEDGTYSRKGDYPGAEDTENPVRILKERKNIDKNQYTLANVIGTFKITSWLKLTTSFSR